MKLYDCKTAPSPRRVRIFAAEKGLPLETIQVDLANNEQLGAAFREINPDCVVPVLELDDGTRITEVLGICLYLEELQPEPALIGRSARERALAMSWALKAEQQGLLSLRDAFRNTAKGLRGRALTGPVNVEQIPALAERGRTGAAAFFDRLDDQLGTSEFVAGDTYSIADITALVFVDFAAWIKLGVPDNAVNLKRWHQAAASRPSASA